MPKVQVYLEGVDATQPGVKSALATMEGAAGRLKGILAGVAATVAGVALGSFFKSAVEEAGKATVASQQLGQAVENFGGNFEQLRPRLDGAVNSVVHLTKYTDDDLSAALTTLISISGDVGGSMKNLQLAADLAAAKHIDLASAAQLVGKAMAGETGTLKRYGIVVSEGADAIELMRTRFHGFAEGEAKTLGGRLEILGRQWAEVKEAIGNAILGSNEAGESLGGLARVLENVEAWIRRNEVAIGRFVDSIAQGVIKLTELAQQAALVLNPDQVSAQAEITRIQGITDPKQLEAHMGRLSTELTQLIHQRDALAGKLDAAVKAATSGREGHELAVLAQTGADQKKLNDLEEEIAGLDQALDAAGARLVALRAKPSTVPLPPPPPGKNAGKGSPSAVDRHITFDDSTRQGASEADQAGMVNAANRPRTPDAMIGAGGERVSEHLDEVKGAAEEVGGAFEEMGATIASSFETAMQGGESFSGSLEFVKRSLGKQAMAHAIHDQVAAISAAGRGLFTGDPKMFAAAAQLEVSSAAWFAAASLFGGGGGGSRAGGGAGGGGGGGEYSLRQDRQDLSGTKVGNVTLVLPSNPINPRDPEWRSTLKQTLSELEDEGSFYVKLVGSNVY